MGHAQLAGLPIAAAFSQDPVIHVSADADTMESYQGFLFWMII